jgi:intermediate peptidase
VETPSNLLELFVDDHRVLRQFAKHYSTGEIIPARVVDGLRQSKRMFSAMDLQTQVGYCTWFWCRRRWVIVCGFDADQAL